MRPIIKPLLCRGLLLGVCAMTLGLASAPVRAAAFEPGQWRAVSADRLAALRGGFEAAPGLKVSFGMVRSVAINGELVSRTSFQLPDLSRITEDQARLASRALSEAGLVQNGPGNYVQRDATGLSAGSLTRASQAALGSMAGLGAATVIQNTLDNQVIRQLTEINAGVNTLSLLKMVNAQLALRDAVLGGMGVR